jgi:hypothetical protein
MASIRNLTREWDTSVDILTVVSVRMRHLLDTGSRRRG